MKSVSPKTSSHRRGFVLVLVLVLILVTGLSAAGFARKSFELARTVADAQEELQRRWGMRSLERFALTNPTLLLDGVGLGGIGINDSAAGQYWPLRHMVDLDIELGGIRFAARLSDEDAKIDLNMLSRRGNDPQNLLSNVTQQAAAASGLAISIRWTASDAESKIALAFQTWEQVFDLRTVDSSDEMTEQLRAATVELTCWGTGKLNLRRAPDSTVRLLLDGEVSENSIARLLGARREGGFRDLEKLVKKLDLKNKDEAMLKRLLSIDSKRFAVWVTSRSPRRAYTSLTIDRSGKGNPSNFETFHW